MFEGNADDIVLGKVRADRGQASADTIGLVSLVDVRQFLASAVQIY